MDAVNSVLYRIVTSSENESNAPPPNNELNEMTPSEKNIASRESTRKRKKPLIERFTKHKKSTKGQKKDSRTKKSRESSNKYKGSRNSDKKQKKKFVRR